MRSAGSELGAAVLAAGLGERLRACGCPKPLVRVAGLPLVERAVRTLRAGGVRGKTMVVVGHRGEEVAEFVRSRFPDVEVLENPDYARGNGTSVLGAVPHLPERFVVAMVDHVHTPDSVRRLIATPGDFVAAVDSRPSFADPGEATRVRLESGRVVALGKGLEPYDALDAGLFVCSRAALEPLGGEPGPLSWNAIKRKWLASGGELAACDLAGAPWADVDTPEDIERAVDAVLAATRGSRDGFISRHLNRRLGRGITRRLLDTSVTPDQVSLMSFALAAASAGLLARGSLAAGGVLVQLSSVLDGCDGELARARLESSAEGQVLDAVLDRGADALIIAGMALGSRSRWGVQAGFLALAGALMVPYTRARWEAAFGEVPEEFTGFAATRDVRLGVLALGALTGVPASALLAVGAGAAAEVVRRLLALRGRRLGERDGREESGGEHLSDEDTLGDRRFGGRGAGGAYGGGAG
ncbi:di-myo-inositol-1,3'-phosphate-1'-phosphate synthase [Rubrobacter taiwanensis]|jgi:choline kinase/phosphatidylglycerophosphate synthase|uniref:Bifunctional IPC transferase and DIPP synthase n=1 Tax=Rubrobacter taiwanensis TaxID=185139 RepID=A0A4R1BI82_9ACTN|nr:NTP transferase domain-containing protein [Rubrobacter taiwanensis]TCJ16907.1 di-myo-inositol-1,3'-phosphate-1'-phosphate synthase [Rubrobacter taiwanensis]